MSHVFTPVQHLETSSFLSVLVGVAVLVAALLGGQLLMQM